MTSVQASASGTDWASRAIECIQALEANNTRLREALRRADVFISNGIDLGFIRMPDAGSDDPALETPGIIRAALESVSVNQ